jgi:two-component system chemotaxis response regulator CheV
MLAYKDSQSGIKRELLQFVTFDLSLSGRVLTMALNVQKIKEVVQFENLSLVPSQDDLTLGVYDLGGCPIPVLNLQKLMGSQKYPESGVNEHFRLVICELQNLWVGIPVIKTGRLITCVNEDFLPPPPGSKIENTRLVSGLIRREKTYVPVLDVDSLIQSAGYADLIEQDHLLGSDLYQGKRVLLVDDSRIIVKRLEQFFVKLGCVCWKAFDGESAIQTLIENQFQFDLIFTDIEMPILDGVAMVRKIKTYPESTKIPVLFNSALSNPVLVKDIEKEGLGTYLVKFDEALILKQLDQVFKKNS